MDKECQEKPKAAPRGAKAKKAKDEKSGSASQASVAKSVASKGGKTKKKNIVDEIKEEDLDKMDEHLNLIDDSQQSVSPTKRVKLNNGKARVQTRRSTSRARSPN